MADTAGAGGEVEVSKHWPLCHHYVPPLLSGLSLTLPVTTLPATLYNLHSQSILKFVIAVSMRVSMEYLELEDFN